MTDSGITFTDLPPDPRGVGKIDWYAIADDLRANPGQWAIIDGVASVSGGSLATSIKAGGKKPFRPAGSFEAATRQNGEKQELYVRYVGDQS